MARLTFSVLIVLLASAAGAQDLEPRRYFNNPVGQNYFLAPLRYSYGEVNVTPSLPLDDADLSLLAGSVAYLRSFDFGGRTASFDAFLPLVCADGSAVLEGQRRTRETCGQGDLRLRLVYNFVGAPALRLDEFVGRQRELVIGASIQVEAPIGQYDKAFLLNIGANRWILRPEIGMSVPLGRWSVEFAAGARFFEDNDEFFGGSRLSQDPLYNLQTHVVYDLSPRQWLSINANYFFGGATFRDGMPSQIRQGNSRLGVTWSIAANRQNVIQLTANAGVVTRIGNDSTTFGVAWLRRWE